MSAELRRRDTDTELSREDVDVLVNVSMSITAETRIVEDRSSPWEQREPTGRRFGEIEAEIVNPSIDYVQTIGQRVVLKWPDREMFVLMVPRAVKMEAKLSRDVNGRRETITVAHIDAIVLRLAEYGGAHRLTEGEAHRSLMAPPKRLAESSGG